ncbi:MAG: CAP domain-containing protein [Candidatus Sericytochromatia bacterium]
MTTSQIRLLIASAILLTAGHAFRLTDLIGFEAAASNIDVKTVQLADEAAPAQADLSIVGEVTRLTNLERSRAGLPALSLDPRLSQAAQQQAWSMASSGQFKQVIDGQGPAERVSATGYRWSTVGENIAMDSASPADVLAGWMRTDGHKANLLGISYTEMGVGFAIAADGRPYWVQIFARS